MQKRLIAVVPHMLPSLKHYASYLTRIFLTNDVVPLKDFCPDSAIELWSSDKLRRPNQNKRKKHSGASTSAETSSGSESESEDMLTEWDSWMSPD